MIEKTLADAVSKAVLERIEPKLRAGDSWPALMDYATAARYLGRFSADGSGNARFVEKLVRDKQVPRVLYDGRPQISRRDLDGWIDKNRHVA